MPGVSGDLAPEQGLRPAIPFPEGMNMIQRYEMRRQPLDKEG